MRPLPLLPVALIIFISGFCSLVYQSVWFREFRLIFGASTLANSAVLAIFMAGLGIGGLVLGHRADKWRRPFNNYAYIEFAIAALAALTPFLLDFIRTFYINLGGSAVLGDFNATLLRLLLATLVIFPSVFVMGGTLPAAARAITTKDDTQRHGLAVLYAINTLGAVMGVTLSTFILFEANGFRMTLWLAVLLNILIALSARVLARNYEVPLEDASEETSSEARKDDSDQADKETASRERRNVATPARPWLLPAAFITGFVFFLSELVWYRLAAPILGGSTYTFGVILAVALLGIGMGGYIHSLRSHKGTASVAEFGITCTLQALFLLIPFALGDNLALLAYHLHNFGMVSFNHLSAGWAIITGIMVLPAALVAGYQFPLMFALKGQGVDGVAKDTGQIYAANTLGAIVGALAGGFGLIPLLGANGAWLFAVAVLLLLGIFLIVITARTAVLSTVVSSIFALLTLSMFFASGPTSLWKHTAIGAGRAYLQSGSSNELRSRITNSNRTILESYDGIESNLGFGVGNALSIIVNGKSDGNVIGDAITQVFLGLIPAVIHGNAESAFVIGLGTGETAGWLAEVDSIKSVEVAEIEPKVLRFVELAAAANFNVAQHPKVTMKIGDGREALITSDKGYDLIVSEPSNPYRAGIASFYTQEFYEQAALHLNEGGYFAQWVQMYEITPEAIEMVVNTMAQVFPRISYWTLSRGDLLLVGSFHEQVYDAAQMQELSQQHPFSTALRDITQTENIEGFLTHHVAQPSITPAILEDVHLVNRDDSPLLEYMFARSVGRSSAKEHIRTTLLEQAQAQNALLPALKNGQADVEVIQYNRARATFGFPEIALVTTEAQTEAETETETETEVQDESSVQRTATNETIDNETIDRADGSTDASNAADTSDESDDALKEQNLAQSDEAPASDEIPTLQEAIKDFWRYYSSNDIDNAYPLLELVEPHLNTDFGRFAALESRALYLEVHQPEALSDFITELQNTDGGAYQTELEVLTLFLALRNHNEALVQELLPEFIRQSQSDPWIFRDTHARTLVAMGEEELSQDTTLQLIDALLEQPFAVYNLQEFRIDVLLSLAAREFAGQPIASCSKVYDTLSEVLPWNYEVLRDRLVCYSMYNHPQTALAEKDFIAYSR